MSVVFRRDGRDDSGPCRKSGGPQLGRPRRLRMGARQPSNYQRSQAALAIRQLLKNPPPVGLGKDRRSFLCVQAGRPIRPNKIIAEIGIRHVRCELSEDCAGSFEQNSKTVIAGRWDENSLK